MGDLFVVGSALQVAGPILTVLLWLPVILYLVARWRTYEEGLNDNQLGLKVALSFFKVAAYQISLAGLFLLVYALMSDSPGEAQEQILRTAAGLLVPGLIVYGAHFYAYNHTNHREIPTVDRLFAGVNLLQTGLVGFVSLLVACFLLFQKDIPDETERLVWSLVIVYSLAWIVQGLLFARTSTLRVGGGRPGAAGAGAGSDSTWSEITKS
jgi:hypothetical protein